MAVTPGFTALNVRSLRVDGTLGDLIELDGDQFALLIQSGGTSQMFICNRDGTVLSFFTVAGVGTNPSMTQLVNGNIAIASQDANSVGVQIVSTAGVSVLPFTDLNDTNTTVPEIAALTGGGFVVVLQDLISGDTDLDYAIYNAAGSLVFSGFVEDGATADTRPVVTGITGGGFAVAFTRTVAGETELYYAIHNANGSGVLLPTLLDTSGTIARNPAITRTNTGFAIAYESNAGGGSSNTVQLLFSPGGGPLGSGTITTTGADTNADITEVLPGVFAVVMQNDADGDSDILLSVNAVPGAGVTAANLRGGVPSNNVMTDPAVIALSTARLIAAQNDTTLGVVHLSIADGARTHLSDGAGDTINGDGLIDRMRGEGGNDTLNGGDNDDILDGGAGTDTLNGGNGIDTADYGTIFDPVVVSLATAGQQDTIGAGLDTLIGIENLTGTGTSDVLIGDAQANRLNGAGGNDTLIGGLGDDILDGGSSTDTVSYAGGAAVTVNLALSGPQNTIGAGIDTLIGVENLTGSSFNDTLTGDGTANTLAGGSGDDTLNGGGGNGDQVRGGDGSDLIIAGAGNESLAGDFGGETGPGIDTLSYVNAASGITISLLIQTVQNTGGSGLDSVREFENVIGSSFGDDIIGNVGNNVIDGGGGGDFIRGGDGNDTLNGGDAGDFLFGDAGNDTLVGGAFSDNLQGGPGDDILDGSTPGFSDTASYVDSTAGVTVSLLVSGPQNTIGAGIDTLIGIERIEGSVHDDVLIGNATSSIVGRGGNDILFSGGGNALSGEQGDDRLVAGPGDDNLGGFIGTDTADYSQAASGVTVSLLLTTAQATGGSGTDTLDQIENLVGSLFNDTLTAAVVASTLTGASGDDLLVATGVGDVLLGGDGNDRLVNSVTGNDTLDGGAGTDAVLMGSTGDQSQTLVDLTVAAPQTTGQGTLTFTSIEDLFGAATRVVFLGTAGANTLVGSTAADELSGRGGDDLLNGGLGDDVIAGGDGVDTASYDGAANGVAVSLMLQGAQTTGGAGTDTLTGIENLTGSDTFADALTGDDGANTLSGRGGNDVLAGGLGNDRLDGGAGNDTADYANITGFRVVVNLDRDGVAQQTEGAGEDTLIGIENVIGTVSVDILAGNAGNNALIGGAGNDVIEGGLGDDIIDGGVGEADFAAYVFATAGVTVSLRNQGAAQNTFGAGLDTLTGIEFVAGSSFNDVILGDDNVNALFGSDGDDVIEGGGGAVDVIFGGNNVGLDLAAYVFAPAGVTIDLNLLGLVQNTGGAGADLLDGIEGVAASAHNDVLIGNGAVNGLFGGDGFDIIDGRGGFDLLGGGAQADVFVFGLASDSITVAPDIIVDFEAGIDKLDFRGMNLTANDRVTIGSAGQFTFVDIDRGLNGSIDFRVILGGNPAVTRFDMLGVPANAPAAVALMDAAADDPGASLEAPRFAGGYTDWV